MNLKKLIKKLEAETDKEKTAETIQKIDSLLIEKGVLRMGPIGYLKPLDIESQVCKRDTFEEGYFDCDAWGNNWGGILYGRTVYISSLTISNRIFSENPEYGKAELVRELDSTLNGPKIIIIPSLESDTAGHADTIVRFLDDQTVLRNEALEPDGFNQQLKATLQYRDLDVLEFPFAPTNDRSGVGCYLNYLETDEAVFLPIFGINADARAVAAAEKMFSKPVESVKIPNIAADGGLHSISWDMSYYVWSD